MDRKRKPNDFIHEEQQAAMSQVRGYHSGQTSQKCIREKILQLATFVALQMPILHAHILQAPKKTTRKTAVSKLTSLVVLLLSVITAPAIAQIAPDQNITIDSSFLVDHTDKLILRAYGSNKFTRLTFGDYGQKEKVLYKPNSNYNIGIGFNYKFLGINLGFRTPGINNDNDKYGKTKYLDLQAYVYARKLTIDFYGQTYEGYYLANNSVLKTPPAGDSKLIRSDIQTRNLGANLEYIFNNMRFSYRAIYLQNERQKKSAGSFVLGGGVHFLNVRADSAILPPALANPVINGDDDFDHYSVGSLALNGGYAHTFVINESFFVMGSLLLGAGVNFTQLTEKSIDAHKSHVSFHGDGILRLGAGYNSDKFYAGIYFTTNLMGNNLPLSGGNSWQQYETGVLRIAVARRFTKIPKAFRIIDKVQKLVAGK